MSPLDQARAALSAWDDPCSHDVVEETNTGGRTWHSCRLAADHDGLHHWQPPALAEHLRAALAEVDRLAAERDEAANVIAASERWITLRDEARRLDALARPGGEMDDDDLLNVVVRVLRRAADKGGSHG